MFCPSLPTHGVLVAEESAAPARHTAVVTTIRVTLTTLVTFTAGVISKKVICLQLAVP